jgi:hypothetical protein
MATLTCGHGFTEANVQAGTYHAPARTFVPPPAVCSTCRRLQCDDCAANDMVCSCCGGGICAGCQPTARQREIHKFPSTYRERNQVNRQYLCSPCAEKQDAKRSELHCELARITSARHLAWLSDIVADLESALAEAKKAL